MFAGPNGSGKTVLFEHLRSKGYIHTEIYVSADRIEKDLKNNKKFFFSSYHVKASESEFIEHIKSSGLYIQIPDKSFIDKISIESGNLKLNGDPKEINSYTASFIATYLCEKLMETKQSFCFETVLSHPSKIDFIKKAKSVGYKTYLYFVITDNFQLNIERIKLRVKDGGHDVDHKKIETRYFRSLNNFYEASRIAHSTFLIDNSIAYKLITELNKGKVTNISDKFPDWFRKYFNPDSL